MLSEMQVDVMYINLNRKQHTSCFLYCQ